MINRNTLTTLVLFDHTHQLTTIINRDIIDTSTTKEPTMEKIFIDAAITKTVMLDLDIGQLTSNKTLVSDIASSYILRGPEGWFEFAEDVSAMISELSGRRYFMIPTLLDVAEAFGQGIDEAEVAFQVLDERWGIGALTSHDIVIEA